MKLDINGYKRVLDVFIASLMAASCTVPPIMASGAVEDFEVPEGENPSLVELDGPLPSSSSSSSRESVAEPECTIIFKCKRPGVVKADDKRLVVNCKHGCFFSIPALEMGTFSVQDIKITNKTTNEEYMNWQINMFGNIDLGSESIDPGDVIEVEFIISENDVEPEEEKKESNKIRAVLCCNIPDALKVNELSFPSIVDAQICVPDILKNGYKLKGFKTTDMEGRELESQMLDENSIILLDGSNIKVHIEVEEPIISNTVAPVMVSSEIENFKVSEQSKDVTQNTVETHGATLIYYKN